MPARMTKASCSLITRSIVIPLAELKIKGDCNQRRRTGSANLAFKMSMTQYYLITQIKRIAQIEVLTRVTFHQKRDVKLLCRQLFLLFVGLMIKSVISSIRFFVRALKNTTPS